MRRLQWPIVVLIGLALGLLVLVSGCQSEECARMMSCCEAIKDVEGVGNACGSRASSVDDPKTCQTILDTVDAMFDKKERELPAACQQ